jgi:hypothetical protein
MAALREEQRFGRDRESSQPLLGFVRGNGGPSGVPLRSRSVASRGAGICPCESVVGVSFAGPLICLSVSCAGLDARQRRSDCTRESRREDARLSRDLRI